MSIQTVIGSASTNRGVPTAISLVVDRSGSMSPYLTNVIQSVSQFVTEQTQNKGKAYLTISQFDHNYEVIFKNKDIKEVDPKQFTQAYYPRGSTALRDAIVQAAADMDQHLSELQAKDKPKKVIIGLITDGDDNMSTNTTEKVRCLIQEKERLGWDFLLLGAEQNTMQVGKDLGISEKKTAIYLADRVQDGIKLLSNKVTQARRGQKVEIDQGERKALLGASAKKDEL